MGLLPRRHRQLVFPASRSSCGLFGDRLVRLRLVLDGLPGLPDPALDHALHALACAPIAGVRGLGWLSSSAFGFVLDIMSWGGGGKR